MQTLKKLQESHATIKASLGSLDLDQRKRKTPVTHHGPKTTLGAATNLDLRPREIIVKNCDNAEELHEHFR